MNLVKMSFVSLLFMMMSGCASIINGTSQDVTFRSDPEGALVIIDGLERGKTPITLNLKKNEYKTVTFRKDGYQDTTQQLTTQMDLVAWLNIFWDLSTTDAITGAIQEYEPSAYHASLKKTN